MKVFPRFLVVILVLSFVAGCDRDEQIRVYSAPKESPASTTSFGASAGATGTEAHSDEPTWRVPESWTPTDGPQFSVAAFKVSKNDPAVMVTVSPLARAGADLLTNVNRWESQVGLPPSPESDLSKLTRTIDTPAGATTMVELKGPKASLRAAIIPSGERVWFVKLMGPANVVDEQKDNFDAFVRSIKFGGAPDQPSSASESASAPASFDGATWTAPPGWTLQPPKQMRVATYRTSNDANAPEVIITRFAAGGFGSLLDNINRWRNQLGMQPIADEKNQPFETMTISGSDAHVYDLLGNVKHLRVAMVPAGDHVWFFRLDGPKDAVAPQIPNFDAFLKTVQLK